ncbi:MAG TPA: universal stress protein [candidate division Zixibacteria bacterium]|nr:universal stress protein [candidate division Zixibacteria bacterium]
MEIRNILLPTDFSEQSEVAVPFAIDLARRYHAKLHILHVFDENAFDPAFFSTAHDIAEEFFSRVREGFEAEVDSYLEKYDTSGVGIVTALANGSAFAEIIKYARANTIDMIVMATHGRTGLASVLLGNVTEKVVHKANCPVLTVRHPDYEFEPI